MLNYIVRRIGYAVLILIGVNLLTFTLFFAVNSPDNIARLNIGAKRVSQDAIEKWKAERGYDKPLWFNAKAEGADKFRKTIFYDRSLKLFTLEFGTSDSGRDIAPRDRHPHPGQPRAGRADAAADALLRHHVLAAAGVLPGELPRLLGHGACASS